MKRQKGITLIALIITIIVMLILVGVTVTTAINGGLFESTRKASRDTQKQSVLEELNALTAEFNADLYANPDKYYNGEENIDAIIMKQTEIRILGENNENPNSSIGESGLAEEDDGYYFYISFVYKGTDAKWKFVSKNEEGTIDYIELILNGITIQEIGETPTINAVGNIKEVKEGVPIPKGFYYVTGTKNTGIVISDNQLDENNATGNNGNQFVWVPVQTNPKLKIIVDGQKTISKVTIMDLEDYNEEIDVQGKTYFEKTIDAKNSIYEVAVEYADGTKEEELYVTRLQYVRISSIIQLLEFFASKNGGLEGLADYYATNQGKTFEFKIEALKDWLQSTSTAIYDTEDITPEEVNVLKYGGFYIGRYEMGEDGTVKKENTPKNNISYTNAKTGAEAKYNSDEYGIKSTLPSGAAWNSIVTWFIKSNTMTWNDVFFDSTSWGNYRSTNETQGIMRTTGSSEVYSKNNIYDLAGNLQEWTTEAESNNEKISRGDSYNSRPFPNISSYPKMVSKNSKEESTADVYTGYRLMLYIK